MISVTDIKMIDFFMIDFFLDKIKHILKLWFIEFFPMRNVEIKSTFETKINRIFPAISWKKGKIKVSSFRSLIPKN